MGPNGKATSIGVVTGLSLEGTVQLVQWLLTDLLGLPPIPPGAAGVFAGLVAGCVYRVMPASDRTPGGPKP